jgi:protein-tyrosine phosphatase
MPAPSPAVLFVCLGNICRSPLAEAAFRVRAEAAGLEVVVASAGVGGWHVGDAPDRRAQAVAKQHGLDISGYRGQQVEREDFERFTHIYALDTTVLERLRQIAPPTATAHLGLLLDVVPGSEGRSVADPYFGGPEGFERTWTAVDAAAAALVRRLQDKAGAR